MCACPSTQYYGVVVQKFEVSFLKYLKEVSDAQKAKQSKKTKIKNKNYPPPKKNKKPHQQQRWTPKS